LWLILEVTINVIPIVASSPMLAQVDCRQLTLEHLLSVRQAPTTMTEPSVQLDLDSGIICRRASESETVISDQSAF